MRSAIFFLSVASLVSATLTITQPSAAHWWVGQSLNTLAWDGSDPSQFSVFLANPDTSVLTSMLALESIVMTYQTSLTINPGNIKAATGYTLLLTNPLNSSDVYATSESFEIKPVGSTYPPQTTTGNTSTTATFNTSGTATGAGTAPSGTGSSSSGATATSSEKCLAMMMVLAVGGGLMAML
ncbi:hypothetical protein CI109_101681 [Kwoniella shandongensis]|uniref:Uncharacterized protein n=1 Tax=Kwoniella shandongensis TaxID=1734106 RepID=A0A5M6C9C2_9TREE|nr:uncharacterized protein CI109_001195 [Kwoniella shandongensis]KAA5530392.1 hypothetical protein CI109_001195 [Kwoniella shandongensis]